MAFAPSFDLLSVPSSLQIKASVSRCACGDLPLSFGAMILFTFATALSTPHPMHQRFVAQKHTGHDQAQQICGQHGFAFRRGR